MVIWNNPSNNNSMGCFRLNDKFLNLAMLIFFAGIIINGLLLMVALTPAGGTIIGLTRTDLTYDSLSDSCVLSTPSGFLSNTPQSQDASSFNPIECRQASGIDIFAGLHAINSILLGLFLLEAVFFTLSYWFPIFSPILLSIAAIFVGAKLLLIGYAGSILLNSIFGRR